MKNTDLPRLIAFYLTQFHPTPENDLWWGKGFTEWTNVTKTKPLYDGHYQPHLPTDFGFYDLRVRETRHDQIKTAKQYGIDGFCYHYYWFSGRRILNAPLDDMLADTDSDMPFCLCWANENWTRRWDAADHELLIAQKYLPDDDLNFIKSLIPFISDPRYIKVDGAPVLIVYRPQHLPDPKKSIAIWREYCASIGIPKLHLVCALTHGNVDYEQFGFEAGVEFPPHNRSGIHGVIDAKNLPFKDNFSGVVCEYKEVAELYLNRTYKGSNVYRSVYPSWDNTARVGNRAFITLNGTPENYQRWLNQTILKTQKEHPNKDRLVFINAWNEWAEGCHLEPDRKYGNGFLVSTLNAKHVDGSQPKAFTSGLPMQSTGESDSLLNSDFNILPSRLAAPSFCSGHLPFINWILKVLKPRSILELGTTADGNSICMFSETNNKLNGNAIISAISEKSSAELSELASYLGNHYPKTRLIHSSVDAVANLADYENDSIDLLYFNDFRSGEHLNKTLQHWREKLSDKAVVLIHNTNWISEECDIHEFWNKLLLSALPSFNFLHSHGMGVLLLGKERNKLLLQLSDADTSNDAWIRVSYKLQQAGRVLELQCQNISLEQNLSSMHGVLNELKNSKSWRLTEPIRKLIKTFN